MRLSPSVLVAACAAIPGTLSAAPQSVKLSWASADAATAMGISWVTSANSPTTVEYGINSVSENMLTGLAPNEIAGIGWMHEIELANLLPNTTYKYRVGSQGDWSSEYTFKTAPNDQCTPFTFVQLGDARSQNDRGPSLNWASIQQEAQSAGAQFFLNGGDLVKEGSQISQWSQWLIDSDVVNPYVPMMPAIGNHDDGPGDGNSANYNRVFFLPTNTVTGTEDYYYFVYNNLLIFSLSTQTFDNWQAQMAWLIAVAAQHPNKWKVAFFHHPVYTTKTIAGHPPDEHGQNAHYAPAFDQAGIDIVFQSHNHIYERFRPLRYNPSDVEEGVEVSTYGNGPNDGRLYVVSGGSGAFLDPLIEWTLNPANGSESRSADHHFMKISIAGNTLQYSAINTNAGNIGGGGVVIDQLTITRPGADPCANPMDPDIDGDGYPESLDCNDRDNTINPGAAEICGNTVDEDCNNIAEECPPPLPDKDMDGSPEGTDCDDNNAERFPEHPEVQCDGIDNDCDCFEDCGGQLSDVCAPPDAGVHPDAETPSNPDATTESDAASGDASTSPPSDGGVTPGDAGSTPSPEADGCGCTALSPEKTSPWPGLLGVAVPLVRGRRR